MGSRRSRLAMRVLGTVVATAAALLMPRNALASTGCTAVNAGSLDISGFSATASQAGFAVGDELTVTYEATHINDHFTLSPTGGGPDLDNFHPSLVTTVTTHTLSASQLDLTVTIFAAAGPVSAAVTCVPAPVPAPTVTSILPTSGSTAGATAVTITGTDFTGASSVTIGGAAATAIVVVNNTTITATAPAHAAGIVNVAVTTPGGTGSGSGLYTYAAVPAVTAVNPASGPASGGTSVTITGTGFTGATAVSVGGVAASGVTVVNPTTISAVTSAHAAGVTNVVVTTPGGTGSGTGLYTYADGPAVTSIAPPSGPIAGGTRVTISGRNLTAASSVLIGGVAVTGLSVVDATTVTAMTSAHAAGEADVAVTTPGGTGSGARLFLYAAEPTVTAVVPPSGPIAGGTTITITGIGFSTASAVIVGGSAASAVTIVNDGTLTATTPAHGVGEVSVAVTTAGGTGTSASPYTYVSDLTLASTTASAVAQVGEMYSQASIASGGVPPYAYTVSDGSVPSGTSLGTANGIVSGVPTRSGAFSYTVTVSDSSTPALTASRLMTGTITAILTTTTLASSLNPSLTGQSVTLTASITPSTATGTVAFADGAVTLCGAAPVVNAIATCPVTFSAAGEHPLVALYSGIAALDRSSSAALVQTVTDQRIKTVAVIGRFMSRRTDLIASNAPDMSRQIDRLVEQDGAAGPVHVTANSDGPLQFGYATSFSRLRRVSAAAQSGVRAAGSPQMPLDFWIDGKYGSFSDHRSTDELDGHFSLVSIGADYVLNRTLLLGALVQLDSMRQRSSLQTSEASGHGWMAGPYVTVRLADRVFGQVRAAWGRSSNEVRPFQSYTDRFGTDRWLLASAVSGRFERGPWVLRPSVSVAYLEDASERYFDAFDAAVPSVTSRLGHVDAGPQLEYVYHLSPRVVLQPRVGLQLLAKFAGTTSAEGFGNVDGAPSGPPGTRGRIDTGVRVIKMHGFGLDVSGSYDGIGASDYPALAGRVTVNVPLR